MSKIGWLRKKYFLLYLIDQHNRALWLQVQKSHKTTIEISSEPNYGVFLRRDTAVFYVLPKELDSASFTHELLHVDLDAKGIKTGVFLRVSVKSQPRLVDLLPKMLIEWVPNFWEHIKMLPVFLEMGYQPSQFISDYNSDKGEEYQIAFVEMTLRSGNHYSKLGLEHYIARYFCIVACPNKSFQYDKALKRLRALDPDLYNVLSTFMGKWKLFDINDPSAAQIGERLIDEFTENLVEWTTGKVFN